MIKIIYNSPAVPQKPYDFVLGKIYEIEKVKDKHYVLIDNNNKREFDIDFIKSMFKPCEGCSWDMLEINLEKTNLKKKNKNDKKENAKEEK